MRLQQYLIEYSDVHVSQSDINNLEKVLDKLFKDVKLDIEFTRHFIDRVNDSRNKKQITVGELQSIFQRVHKKYGEEIASKGKDFEAVIVGIMSKVNLPFVLDWNKDLKMLELKAKTVMRKDNFKTRNKKYRV